MIYYIFGSIVASLLVIEMFYDLYPELNLNEIKSLRSDFIPTLILAMMLSWIYVIIYSVIKIFNR